MGVTKTEHFSDRQNTLATLMKALAHPARIAIVEYLIQVSTCICGDIVGELPLAQPTISQHLKELKMAGIIKGTVEGTRVCYCLDETALKVLNEYFTGIMNTSTQKTCC